MKISIHRPRLHNLVFNFILLITLSQSSLAGLEIFFDGKKFFYRSNGKDIPIDMSPGSEVARFQEEFNCPSNRKTRDTMQYLYPDQKENKIEDSAFPSYTFKLSSTQPLQNMGTEVVEKELEGTVLEVLEPEKITRYDIIASLANNIETEKLEEKIDAIISLIREDLERYFHNQEPRL